MATKPQFPANRLVSKQTRPGTPPNHGGVNRLVCISDDNEVRRLPRKQAAELVASGWYYVAKLVYKATHRK